MLFRSPNLVLQVYTDNPPRRCYRCGGNHLGLGCRERHTTIAAQCTLWARIQVPTRLPAPVPPAPELITIPDPTPHPKVSETSPPAPNSQPASTASHPSALQVTPEDLVFTQPSRPPPRSGKDSGRGRGGGGQGRSSDGQGPGRGCRNRGGRSTSRSRSPLPSDTNRKKQRAAASTAAAHAGMSGTDDDGNGGL